MFQTFTSLLYALLAIVSLALMMSICCRLYK